MVSIIDTPHGTSDHCHQFSDLFFSVTFDSLLLRKECCTFSNGEFVKSGLAELELWCGQVNEVNSYLAVLLRIETFFRRSFTIQFASFILQYAGPSWDELKHIRQAVGFLVCFHKLSSLNLQTLLSFLIQDLTC